MRYEEFKRKYKKKIKDFEVAYNIDTKGKLNYVEITGKEGNTERIYECERYKGWLNQ